MNMILGMVQHLQMYSQAYSVVTLHVNQTHILLNILEFYLFIYLFIENCESYTDKDQKAEFHCTNTLN